MTGEVDKRARFHVKFSQDLICQKSLQSVNFDRVIHKIKGGRFWDTVYIKCDHLNAEKCDISQQYARSP